MLNRPRVELAYFGSHCHYTDSEQDQEAMLKLHEQQRASSLQCIVRTRTARPGRRKDWFRVVQATR